MTEDTHEIRPVVIQEDACAWEGWDQSGRGGVRWRTLLSADRTPTRSLTCGVSEIEPGRGGRFGAHRHAQTEVYYFLSGQGVMTIDGVDYPVRAGSTAFVPSHAKHGTRNTGAEPLRFFYVFTADSFAEVVYAFDGETPPSEG